MYETGYSAAEAALESQAHVYIASSSSDRVQGAVSKLKGTVAGQSVGSVHGRSVDLTSDASVKDLINWVSNDTEGGKQNGIDHVIFTAGDSLMLGDLSQVNIDDCKGVSRARWSMRYRC
jgi:NAD(P)-dependent dehydrogenase (short-subunit alcohol dehydrogenase family)